MNIKEHIQYFLDLFPQITKDESDTIETILEWDDEKRAAFFFAKKIFEEETECTQNDPKIASQDQLNG